MTEGNKLVNRLSDDTPNAITVTLCMLGNFASFFVVCLSQGVSIQ